MNQITTYKVWSLIAAVCLIVLALFGSGQNPARGETPKTFEPVRLFVNYSNLEAVEGAATPEYIGPVNRLLKVWALYKSDSKYPRLSTEIAAPVGATSLTVKAVFVTGNSNAGHVSIFGAVQNLTIGTDNLTVLDSAIFGGSDVSNDPNLLYEAEVGTWAIQDGYLRLVIGRDGGTGDTHSGKILLLGVALYFS